MAVSLAKRTTTTHTGIFRTVQVGERSYFLAQNQSGAVVVSLATNVNLSTTLDYVGTAQSFTAGITLADDHAAFTDRVMAALDAGGMVDVVAALDAIPLATLIGG